MTLGDDAALLAHLADHIDGLVIAAFGVGHVPAAAVAHLEQLAATVPVILTSRTGSGASLHSTYGFPGSERDLLNRGLISGGFLSPYQARILLRLLLASNASSTDITKAFQQTGHTTGTPEPEPLPR